MKNFPKALVGCVAALTLIVSGARGHDNLKPGFNLFSTAQDVEIGRSAAAQAERQLPMARSPAATRLVERVGRRLAAHAGGPDYDYRFKVVNLSDLNAFALPGGFVYVHRGLIEGVRTEGELAAVMAHEIAHIALRHPTHQLSKAYGAQAGLGLLGALLGGSDSRGGRIAGTVGGLGMSALFLKFSRSAESEADALGARIMARAGYDPMEMANFFAFMRSQSGSNPGRVSTFLSSHPSPHDRESHIRTEARQLGGGRSRGGTAVVGGLAAAKAELRSLGPAPRMSQVVQPRPSSGLR